MHTEYFYAGLELGFCDEMTKQAIINKIINKGQQLFDNAALGVMRKGLNHPNPLVQKATTKGALTGSSVAKRMSANPELEIASLGMPAHLTAAQVAIENSPAISKALKPQISKRLPAVEQFAKKNFGEVVPMTHEAAKPVGMKARYKSLREGLESCQTHTRQREHKELHGEQRKVADNPNA